MDDLMLLWIGFTVLLTILIGLTVWSRRHERIKWVAVILLPIASAFAYGALDSLQSRPKDISMEWWLRTVREATVLGAQLHEPSDMYLWLQIDGVKEPRAYRLPWDQKTAQQIQEALRQAQRNGNAMRMRLPFEPTLDDREPRFYALPQPALPPKDLSPQLNPQLYEQPGQSL